MGDRAGIGLLHNPCWSDSEEGREMKGGLRSERDATMARHLKEAGVERTTGKCPVCYRTIPNDTLGGKGAFNHYPAACVGGGGK